MAAKLRAEGPDAALDASSSDARRDAKRRQRRDTEPRPCLGRTALKAGGTLRVEHLARWTGRRDADGRVESRFALDLVTDSVGLRERRRVGGRDRAASVASGCRRSG